MKVMIPGCIMIRETFVLCVIIGVTIMRLARSDGNFDTLEPIMRFSPELNVTGEDLFGYTLILHQLDITGGAGVDNTRLV